MDFVEPRYIKGYGRISSLNLIDVVNSKAHVQQYAGQTNVIEFLLGVEPLFIAPSKPWMNGKKRGL